MSITAMKQALEALECLFGIPEQFTGKGGGDVAVWTLGGSYRAQQAIPVLRQAIEQAEKQDCWCHKCNEGRTVNGFPFSMTRMILCPDCGNKRCPKASDHTFPCTNSNEPGQPGSVYTTPQPQREWVGLTYEEVIKCTPTWGGTVEDVARAIEAKLKEKNT